MESACRARSSCQEEFGTEDGRHGRSNIMPVTVSMAKPRAAKSASTPLSGVITVGIDCNDTPGKNTIGPKTNP